MTLEDAESEASRARAAFAKMEHEAVVAREAGQSMPPLFWEHFGLAYITVRKAEREVSRAREREEKGL